MKRHLLYFVTFLLLSSCKDEMISYENNNYSFLGGAGTVHEYLKTNWMLTVDTKEPSIKVPANYLDKVSFTQSELNDGVTYKIHYSLGIFNLPQDTTGYYVCKTLDGQRYFLQAELDSLKKGAPLPPKGYTFANIMYRETSTALFSKIADFLSIGVELKYPLEKDKYWTIYDAVTTRKFAIVEGMEKVSVPAGLFLAYKINIYLYDIYDYSVYSNGTHLLYSEYWCPNVGMVLRESESFDYKNNVHFISRTELISYRFTTN